MTEEFMTNVEFADFSEAMDRCWMDGRVEDLRNFLADDMVLVAPGGHPRLAGAAAAIDSYRQFLAHARVEQFCASHHVVTTRGTTAVGEYAWKMIWVADGKEHVDTGREILVLTKRNEGWRVVWRAQIPTVKA
jgi:ketosteroid isomerase-like protein